MLVNWTQPKHVFIVCGKTDLRKGIDGLAAVVAENYDLDLFDDSLFLFCGTRNVFKYLKLIFEAYTRSQNPDLKAYLPWNPTVQQICGK